MHLKREAQRGTAKGVIRLRSTSSRASSSHDERGGSPSTNLHLERLLEVASGWGHTQREQLLVTVGGIDTLLDIEHSNHETKPIGITRVSHDERGGPQQRETLALVECNTRRATAAQYAGRVLIEAVDCW